MQHTIEGDHRRRAPLDDNLSVAVSTVDISQQLPAPHTQPEILERHRSCMIQQRPGRLTHQLLPAARVGMRPRQLLHLPDTDLTRTQPGTDLEVGCHQPRRLQPSPAVLVRPPNRRPQPAPHRHMTINRVRRTPPPTQRPPLSARPHADAPNAPTHGTARSTRRRTCRLPHRPTPRSRTHRTCVQSDQGVSQPQPSRSRTRVGGSPRYMESVRWRSAYPRSPSRSWSGSQFSDTARHRSSAWVSGTNPPIG